MGSVSTASASPSRPPAGNPSANFKICVSYCGKDASQGTTFSNWIDCYNPQDNSWNRVTTIPGLLENHALKGFSMVSIGEFIYVIGGRLCENIAPVDNQIRSELEVRRQVWRYNVRENKWYKCAPLIVPRFDFACAVINDKIYVAGGKCQLCTATGMASSEVYDPALDEWQSLPDMSTSRHKCVGVTWQGKFHVIGGFAGNNDYIGNMERSSAEVYDGEESRWNLIIGMWQLDIPPYQIVAVDDKLFSSGDCLNSWKGQIEAYDWNLNIWNEVEGSQFEALSATKFVTMAPAGADLYFLAGRKMPNHPSRMTSVVHVFDTLANGDAWRSMEPIEEEGEKELCSHCCVSTSNAHLKKLTVLINPASDKSSPSIKLLVPPPHAESCVPANEKRDVARGDRLEVVRIHVGDAVPGVRLARAIGPPDL
ncbi:F-box/kelch-repeat protein, partial [Cucurbita argyrosperma subsp. argyrosperma]